MQNRKERDVPRKRTPPDPDKPPEPRQYNLVFPGDVVARIERTAAALNVDATALLRIIISLHLKEHEERARNAAPKE